MLSAEFLIASEDAGRRFDQFLASQLPAVSRSRLQDLIKSGHITLNGGSVKPSVKLRPADRIVVDEPPPTTPVDTQPEAIALDVLFEDADLIVLNKAAGMVVHPAAGNWQGTIVNALLHHCAELSGIGGEQRPGIVHRLDKDTSDFASSTSCTSSGCLVAAKSDFAHGALARQFAGREVTKIYLALCAGSFTEKRGTIEAPIGRHPVHRQKMTVLDAARGRTAKTDWRVLREIAAPEAHGGIATLVECTLHTGRTHQIRVHLLHLRHPLVGDEVYGKRAGFSRQMLHAWQLGFSHPRTGEALRFTAPLPADFLAAGVE